MNRNIQKAFLLVSLALLLASATIIVAKAAAAITLDPTTGAPGSSVDLTGTGFAGSKTVGVGWGPPVAVAHDSATVTKVGDLEFYGTTSQYPIEPGSFKYTYTQDSVELYFGDNGDGALTDPAGGRLSSGSINYTSGYFHCIMSSSTRTFNPGYFSYTTYYFNSINSALPILPTDGSGAISGQLTVPQIWNGTETVWVIDEKGNIATSDFTVVESDVIPEALTIGVVMILSSAAVVVATFSFRKRKKICQN